MQQSRLFPEQYLLSKDMHLKLGLCKLDDESIEDQLQQSAPLLKGILQAVSPLVRSVRLHDGRIGTDYLYLRVPERRHTTTSQLHLPNPYLRVVQSVFRLLPPFLHPRSAHRPTSLPPNTLHTRYKRNGAPRSHFTGDLAGFLAE